MAHLDHYLLSVCMFHLFEETMHTLRSKQHENINRRTYQYSKRYSIRKRSYGSRKDRENYTTSSCKDSSPRIIYLVSQIQDEMVIKW